MISFSSLHLSISRPAIRIPHSSFHSHHLPLTVPGSLSWLLDCISTANYPDMLGKAHMINVPAVFMMFWTFVKGMLDPL